MKIQHFIIGALFILFSCQQEDTNDLKKEIMDTDRNFSKMASEKGIAEAFIYYADEKVIKPSSGQQPVVGKFALLEWYKKNPPGDYKLTWEPLKAEASGNLGYTFGGYTLVSKTTDGRDTTQYGNYVSIWKRKKDGTWRYVLDTGNPTPGQVVLE
ncbi:MAG TPA: nuclear transport factor 2 family protein [Cyclobacteriaceae bacterium]